MYRVQRDPNIPGTEGGPTVEITAEEIEAINPGQNVDAIIDQKLGIKPAETAAAAKPAEEGDAGTGAAAAAAAAAGSTVDISWVSPKILETMKSKVPADRLEEIMKNINEDNFLDTLLGAATPNITPEARRMNDFLLKGGKIEDYYQIQTQEVDFRTMAPEDALSFSLTIELGKTDENPEGLSPEDIKAYIAKMDPIDRKVQGAKKKNELINEHKQAYNNKVAEMDTANKAAMDAERIKMASDAKIIIGRHQNISDIYGIPVKKEDVESFNKDFTSLVTPGDDGVVPAAKLLANDDILYKLLFIAHKSGQIKDLLSDAKNQQIQDLKGKLDSKPQTHQGGAGVNNKSEVNYDALSRPAQD